MSIHRETVRGNMGRKLPTFLRPLRLAALLAASLAASVSHAVDKQWVVGDGNWSVNLNWSPFGVPAATDTVRIGSIGFISDETAWIDSQFTVGGVEVSDGMTLTTGIGRLAVLGDTTISGALTTGTFRTTLLIQDGPSVIDYDTDTLAIIEGGQAILNGARLDVDQQLSIGAGDNRLYGSGTIVLGGAGVALVNDGDLSASPEGLVIQSVGGGILDLDGAGGGGRVLANTFSGSTGSQLTFNGGSLITDFGGEMRIVGRGSIAMSLSSPWATSSGSLIRFELNPADPGAAILSGVTTTIGGDVEVMQEAYGRITAATVFESGASTSVASDGVLELDGASTVEGGAFSVATDALLRFDGSTTVNGGDFSTVSQLPRGGLVLFAGPTTWAGGATTVTGHARQQGDANVTQPSTISGGLFDLDGETGGTGWTVNNPLTLNLERIDSGATNRFDGVMSIGGLFGGLSLNLADPEAAWEMSGTLNLAGFGTAAVTRVGGSAMTVTGDVNVDGGAGITADTVLTGVSTVSFANAGSTLLMRGDSRVDNGATFAGSGTLANHTTGYMVLEDGVTLFSADLSNSGAIEVELGPGAVEVGDFTQGVAGEWIVDLGGGFAQTEHDQLTANGSATLAGELTPRLIDAGSGFFVPTIGDDFTLLLAAGGISGTFNEVLPTSIGGEILIWEVQYSPTEARLVLASIDGIAGDYNFDGSVDAADYTVWRDNLGDSQDLAADGNQDGLVNEADYDVWVSNFGVSLGVGETAVAVPEPGTAWLLLGAMALGTGRHRIG